eukprot:TRINITY_DN517_c0_g1_i2.p1 TRINITY_DN517_c0_g1~~TRINITY_DN517_c0_g1_i2.p1  ORF type:complete len:113 (-),score=30.12 TRINITY_DN517_c0_g1_i2:83-421(-)
MNALIFIFVAFLAFYVDAQSSTNSSSGCISSSSSAMDAAILDYNIKETQDSIASILATLQYEHGRLSSSEIDYNDYLTGSDLMSAKSVHDELLNCVNEFNFYVASLNAALRA